MHNELSKIDFFQNSNFSKTEETNQVKNYLMTGIKESNLIKLCEKFKNNDLIHL